MYLPEDCPAERRGRVVVEGGVTNNRRIAATQEEGGSLLSNIVAEAQHRET